MVMGLSGQAAMALLATDRVAAATKVTRVLRAMLGVMVVSC
jgi:hypothetical protein